LCDGRKKLVNYLQHTLAAAEAAARRMRRTAKEERMKMKIGKKSEVEWNSSEPF